MSASPKIDNRNFETILQEIRKLIPFYIPEWIVSDRKDSGSALLKIFAHMFTGTLHQLNLVPEKNFIAFLDMLGVKLLPASQSRAPVTFKLSDGARTTVLIPAKTQMTAQAVGGGDSIVFETERNIVATPTKLVDVYSVNNKEDEIFLAPPDFLAVEKRTPFSARLVEDAQLKDTNLFLDHTSELKVADILKIGETNTLSSIEYVKVDKISDEKVTIKNKLSAKYYTDTLVEKVLTFELFAGMNTQEHILYLGHQEIFNITASVRITLEITGLQIKLLDSNSNLVQWQYWGGQENKPFEWHEFDSCTFESGKLILDKKNNDEITEIEINSIKSRWIRCITVNKLPEQNLPIIKDIKVTSISLPEGETTTGLSPDTTAPAASFLDYCLILNNLQYQDKTEESKTSKDFQPFQPLIDDEHQALYLGFDAPPVKGPISIFFSLEIQAYIETNMPRINWEYYRRQNGKGEWARLDVVDETNNLTQSGIVEFVGVYDFAQTLRFGKSLYWIRAVDINDKFKSLEKIVAKDNQLKGFAPAPQIKGIYLNTTWASQTQSINNEILGSSDGRAEQTFKLFKFPVIAEEIWVDELSALSADERKELLGKPYVKEVKDGKDNTIGFWIKWQPQEELLESTSVDRHYEIDRTFGVIKFGNGTEGAIPPIGADNIIANYQFGGGERGNVDSFAINSLTSSIAYIDTVTNPEPAEGGSDTELLEKALERGSYILKHRNRAVAKEDFEQLTYQASGSIARVKCLPNFNDEKKSQVGWVSVIVIPNSSKAEPQPSLQLRQTVEKYLQNHAANVVISPKHLYVCGPTYFKINIQATLFAAEVDVVPFVEQMAMQKLNAFLHPLTGGDSGQGWEFERLPCLSDFYALLGSIPDLDRVDSLSMTVRDTDTDRIWQITPDSPIANNKISYAFALVCNGKHQIDVKANINSKFIVG
ncbi:putative baseplate assembly protein [Dendronalium sp. ChiSLP03b]|uniref:putative baseplate assembly protein n=1 Tax=Dendronalium sp. ChiSLP03b TaxID=3075381 RepID=UPI002AD52A19|nr:putative baseplate assembly protein [Dendronalium sp. ChiSLP03b]MDZ8208914.1 putative baseplate assembly protein [Dendronalium sp. ChiSLP03b]